MAYLVRVAYRGPADEEREGRLVSAAVACGAVWEEREPAWGRHAPITLTFRLPDLASAWRLIALWRAQGELVDPPQLCEDGE